MSAPAVTATTAAFSLTPKYHGFVLYPVGLSLKTKTPLKTNIKNLEHVTTVTKIMSTGPLDFSLASYFALDHSSFYISEKETAIKAHKLPTSRTSLIMDRQ